MELLGIAVIGVETDAAIVAFVAGQRGDGPRPQRQVWSVGRSVYQKSAPSHSTDRLTLHTWRAGVGGRGWRGLAGGTWTLVVGLADEVGYSPHVVGTAPVGQFCEDVSRRGRIGERGRPDLDSVGSSHE